MTVMEKLQAIPHENCLCGRRHPLLTKEALVVPDGPEALCGLLTKAPPKGKILVICDDIVYDILGKRSYEMLKEIAAAEILVLKSHNLHANEWSIGAAMMEISPETSFVAAVGTGTVNDIARYAAYSARIPYAIIGTSPSMDGFTSQASPLLKRNLKTTFNAIAPDYALLDLPVMQNSPKEMIAAGLGDILGKYIALCDWKLSNLVIGEYICPEIWNLMRETVDTIVAEVDNIPSRGGQAITNLGKGLLLSGAAMQMVNSTRPASGAEHLLSHFWEMRQNLRGGHTALHGDKVGVGTLFMLDYYKKFFEKQRDFKSVDIDKWIKDARAAFGAVAKEIFKVNNSDQPPPETIYENGVKHWDALKKESDLITSHREELAKYLQICGGPTTPAEIGVDKKDLRDALLYAQEIRPRFTITRLAYAWGVHQDIVEELLDEM